MSPAMFFGLATLPWTKVCLQKLGAVRFVLKLGGFEFMMCATRVCAKPKIVHDSGHAKMEAQGGKRTFLSHRFFSLAKNALQGACT